MNTKTCSQCQEKKPISEFYPGGRRPGSYRARCKDCCRKACKRYYSRHKDAIKRTVKIWRATDAGKLSQRQWRDRDYAANSEKYRARLAVRMQIERGAIPSARTLKCSRCGHGARGYHHHLGYAPEHWLDITPLCAQCHSDVHKLETVR